MNEMKYDGQAVVAAIYDDDLGNPLLEAMPPLLSKDKVFERLKSVPESVKQGGQVSAEQRLTYLTSLAGYFQPMPYMYTIYTKLYQAIRTTYTNQTMVETANRICAIRNKTVLTQPWATQPENGSVLGVPGIGKTSTIRRCLSLMPRVIEHQTYKGEPFFCKQIPWLVVECPSDCSVKTLAYSIIHAIDLAVGTSNLERIKNLHAISASALAMQVKVLCLNYHIGIIAIDEIQNVVTTAALRGQTKPLTRFLLEMTNECATGVWFIGTPQAEDVFLAEEHLKRRTRGLRLLPMKPDGTYRRFLEELWQHQYTPQKADLTDAIANSLYDRSGGIPAYLIQLFKESQSQAILTAQPHITKKIINETAQLLAIPIPRHYSVGTSISDISVVMDCYEEGTDASNDNDLKSQQRQKREYANTRGRKPSQRDETDLMTIWKQDGKALIKRMGELDMVEWMPL